MQYRRRRLHKFTRTWQSISRCCDIISDVISDVYKTREHYVGHSGLLVQYSTYGPRVADSNPTWVFGNFVPLGKVLNRGCVARLWCK